MRQGAWRQGIFHEIIYLCYETNELGELVIFIDEKKFDLPGITGAWWEDLYD